MVNRTIELGNLKIEDRELSNGTIHHRVSFSLGNKPFMLEHITPAFMLSTDESTLTYKHIHHRIISDAYDLAVSEGAAE